MHQVYVVKNYSNFDAVLVVKLINRANYLNGNIPSNMLIASKGDQLCLFNIFKSVSRPRSVI